FYSLSLWFSPVDASIHKHWQFFALKRIFTKNTGCMELDKTTYYDLSIFNREEEFSLFHRLDFTTTSGGREYLRQLFSTPLQNISAIEQRQQVLQYLLAQE